MHDAMLEKIAAAAHNGWMEAKVAQGVTSRLSQTGEQLMVPYDDLSEDAKDLDRGMVRSVMHVIIDAGYAVVKQPS